MNNKKQDPRAPVALKIIAEIFLRSTTKFSGTKILPKLNEVDQKLKQRALAAIQSKSPQNTKINVHRISDLGSSPLFQGLDFASDKNKKISENQQRLRRSNQQESLRHQGYLSDRQNYVYVVQNRKQEVLIQKKTIQRQQNRNPQNQLNSSRNLNEPKEVKGNIVSQNLHRNQKGIKDDFGIGDKSTDRKRKFSNQNNKSLVQENKIMTESRAKSNPKDKKTVSFSPQRPKQHFNNSQKEVVKLAQKTSNEKQSNYVYVPPKRRTKQQGFSQLPIQSFSHLPQNQSPLENKTQNEQKVKNMFKKPPNQNLSPIIQRTPRPTEKNIISRSRVIEKEEEVYNISKKSNKGFKKNNNASLEKEQKIFNESQRKTFTYSQQEMRQDWSKIKHTLKYDSSLIASKQENKKVSERQDVALKMIAQLFLNASTRYFPGISMLLKRGVQKQEIENIRSKSSQFNINIFRALRKSPARQQSKTQRRLTWRDEQVKKKNIKQKNPKEVEIIIHKTFNDRKSQKNKEMNMPYSQTRQQITSKFIKISELDIEENMKSILQQNIKLESQNTYLSRGQNQTLNVKKDQQKLKEDKNQILHKKETKLTQPKSIQITETSTQSHTTTKMINKPLVNQQNTNKQLASSKSATTIVQKTIQQKKYPEKRGYFYQPPTKKNSNYVYQPPIKKEITSSNQQAFPQKKFNQNQNKLRNSKSQNTIKIHETSNIQSIDTLKKYQDKQITQSKNQPNGQAPTNIQKQVSILTKKICSLLTLIVKRRLNLNLAHSFQKINNQSKRNFQTLKHVSYLSSAISQFSRNYQQHLKRQSLKKVKTYFFESISKNISQKRIVQQNNRIKKQNKQNIARIIFLILKSKVYSCFQSIKLVGQKVQRKRTIIGKISSVLQRIIKNKASLNTKLSFDKVKKFSILKKSKTQSLNIINKKLKHKILSDAFNILVNKSLKEMNIKLSKSKNMSKVFIKSKSQEVISSLRKQKLQEQKSTIKLSFEDEKKLNNKKKEFDRKINDLQRKKQDLDQKVDFLNKEKRGNIKKNSDIKTKIKQFEKQTTSYGLALESSSSKHNILKEEQAIGALTRAYASLFEDPDAKNVQIQRFLAENQEYFQFNTNSTLMNEWKVLSKNSQLRGLIRAYQGEQSNQKQIMVFLSQQKLMISRLLRSFIRERYIWQWVNIIARE